MTGEIIIAVGFVFFVIGVIAQFLFKGFFKRLLVAALIDSAGIILIFIGIMVRQGFSTFSLKSLVILVLILLINPLASHKMGRSAYLSRLGEKDDN